MDYIDAFSSLKTSSRQSNKAVYKAVLLLAVIDMYEHNIIETNEIIYNKELKSRFVEMWEKVLPTNATLFPDAYMAFWYLQEEKFWHIVPVYGKEYVFESSFSSMDVPSESVFEKSVRYAELDEDLFFLMTLPSGRTRLRKVLLENYSELTDKAIDTMSVSEDNNVDSSSLAVDDYAKMLSNASLGNVANDGERSILTYDNLSDDFQIALNIAYYTFLKNHKEHREWLRNLYPTVRDLYTAVSNSDVKPKDMSHVQMSAYENFLVDLKMNLLSEDDTIAFIDNIDSMLSALHGDDMSDGYMGASCETMQREVNTGDTIENKMPVETEAVSTTSRDNFPWTEYEEELVSLYFKQGRSIEDIASTVGRTTISIKMRLANLGLITNNYGEEKSVDIHDSEDLPVFTIENSGVYCSIFNERGERVFRTNGRFKVLGGMPYRLNYKSMCFTMKGMNYNCDVWEKGDKKIVAYEQSDLYKVLSQASYDTQIEDFIEDVKLENNKVKVDGVWYDFDGYRITPENDIANTDAKENAFIADSDNSSFIPKGKLKDIDGIVATPYDYLFIAAIVDMVGDNPESTIISLDNLACMMIAEAWHVFYCHPKLQGHESLSDLQKCIKYLAKESEDYMDEKLIPQASREMVYAAIKDYPMADAFEDAVDVMLTDAPYDMLKAWLKSDNAELVMDSINFSNACLYALHIGVKNQYIEINKNWMRYIYAEHERLRDYFMSHFVSYIDGDYA